jgi:type IV pilus assembly protein PilA
MRLTPMVDRKNFQDCSEQGFTLIELLVVIIVIGVLSAIALPSFLNQAGRARAAEAMGGLGTMHRSLQAYRVQFSTFPQSRTSLDTRVSGKFYTFDYQRINANEANTSAFASGTGTGLRNYRGAVYQGTNPDFFGQAICESLANGVDPGSVVAPISRNDRGACSDTTLGRLID